jgi:hypothetical protein
MIRLLVGAANFYMIRLLVGAAQQCVSYHYKILIVLFRSQTVALPQGLYFLEVKPSKYDQNFRIIYQQISYFIDTI